MLRNFRSGHRAVQRALGVAALSVWLAMPMERSATALAGDSRWVAAAVVNGSARAADVLRCHATAARRGEGPRTVCLATATGRFERWQDQSCPDRDTCTSLAASADAFVEAVVARLAPPVPPPETRRCITAKLRAVVDAVSGTARCRVRAARDAADACEEAVGRRLATRWARAESGAVCATGGDVAELEQAVEAFVDDLARLATAEAAACVPGTYDVVAEAEPYVFISTDPSVGRIQALPDGALHVEIRFGVDDALVLTGAVGASGRLDLDGYLLVSDIAFSARGAATARSVGAEQRVDGNVDVSWIGEVRALSFMMTRPATGTPPTFGGVHRFTFHQSPDGLASDSRASIELEVAADGSAVLMPAIETDREGALRGTFGAGVCWVSPRGRMHCSTTYDAVDESSPAADCDGAAGPTCLILLSGALPSAAQGVGSGDFLLGWIPWILSYGSWSAAR